LSKPYTFFLNRNSSELSKNILSEVNRVIVGVLMPLMMSVMKLVAATFILGMLVLVDPLLAFTVMAVIGAAYTLVYLLVRKRLAFYGTKIGELAGDRFKFASEAFGGIKDAKLLGKESEFVNRYSEPSRAFAIFYASSQIITQLPRFALEVIAFGGILLIVLYLLKGGQNISDAMPLIALYAFAGYRLMPALQVLYSNLSTLRYNYNALELLHDDFSQFKDASKLTKNQNENVSDKSNELSGFKNKIELKKITYTYPNSDEHVINNIDLTIHANTTVGIVGSTGSGKTTVIDIILGLLEPCSGSMTVDNILIDDNNVRNWQENLGYVPQSIYLTDDTLRKNIAFGFSEDEIDNNALTQAAEIANISDFIRIELPDGYNTNVGERGVRLSGGQRQRIGIARALYRNPKVLILEAATRALDGETESVIMDAINKLAHKKTIIMIAHRLTTVMTCDVIYILDKGKIVESGTYSQLMETSTRFQKMANVGIS